MTTYISFLRGINVSGQKLIKMDALRTMYAALTFENIKTYVQSGNVIFCTAEIEASILEEKISRQIKITFGFDVPVVVLTADCLSDTIKNNPLAADESKDKAFLHVTFLADKPKALMPDILLTKKQDGEEIHFSDNAIYLFCPNGYGQTKLTNNFIESKLKVAATTRNWKTMNEILKITQLKM